MRRRWSIILPLLGLLLFSVITIRSMGHGFGSTVDGKHVGWGSLQLDPDPLNHYPHPEIGCKGGGQPCWPPISVDMWPGAIQTTLVIAALPAFIVGAWIVNALARIGTSEVISFLTAMPLLIGGWFYCLGWLIDRRRWRKLESAKLATGN